MFVQNTGIYLQLHRALQPKKLTSDILFSVCLVLGVAYMDLSFAALLNIVNRVQLYVLTCLSIAVCYLFRQDKRRRLT
jgi:hypothetical protein